MRDHSRNRLTQDVDETTNHQEERQLSHGFLIYIIVTNGVIFDVAQTDNGNGSAHCQQYESSKCAPNGCECVSQLSNDLFIGVWKASYPSHVLTCPYIWD